MSYFDAESPAAPLSDEAVLQASLTDPRAFSTIVERYELAFVRKAEYILHSKEEAEEVVQEAFLKIYQYGERFRVVEGASFRSWAYRILLNVAFTRYQNIKARRAHTAPLSPELYEVLADVDTSDTDARDIRDEVITTLALLPEHTARIIRLFFLEDRSHQEIAALEHISEGASKTRIHRAKQAFKLAASTLYRL